MNLRILSAPLFAFILFKGCDKAPKYKKPPVETPSAYKESAPENFKETDDWKFARPSDDAIRGKWWEIFNDPQLNALIERANSANQSVALAEANFRAARAVIKESRSELYPRVTTNPSITNSRQSSSASQSPFTPKGAVTDYSLPFDASWEPDFWHRIRNTVKANAFEAQATAGDLENTRLSVQGELAANYFQLRANDAQKQLLDATVAAYEKALELTKVQFETGIASDEDVAQAQTQLETTRAQATDLGIERAQFEHAIAVLTGQPASMFSINFEPVERRASSDSLWCSVAAPRTAPGHRRRRASRGGGECADWRRESSVLSIANIGRSRRVGEFFLCELANMAGAVLVRWTITGSYTF
jgi:NodT family efflux transporter outer membrane factor (OMF) lipoprotein